jgi:hypothetical protein
MIMLTMVIITRTSAHGSSARNGATVRRDDRPPGPAPSLAQLWRLPLISASFSAWLSWLRSRSGGTSMLNRAARDHVNHILIGVRSTQNRQNSSQMSSYSRSALAASAASIRRWPGACRDWRGGSQIGRRRSAGRRDCPVMGILFRMRHNYCAMQVNERVESSNGMSVTWATRPYLWQWLSAKPNRASGRLWEMTPPRSLPDTEGAQAARVRVAARMMGRRDMGGLHGGGEGLGTFSDRRIDLSECFDT